jgi:hypothetical protein
LDRNLCELFLHTECLHSNMHLIFSHQCLGVIHKTFQFPPKAWLGNHYYFISGTNFVRSRKGIKQFKANNFFILASKMLKVHREEFNCLCNWIMTDLCVQKTNQILRSIWSFYYFDFTIMTFQNNFPVYWNSDYWIWRLKNWLTDDWQN